MCTEFTGCFFSWVEGGGEGVDDSKFCFYYQCIIVSASDTLGFKNNTEYLERNFSRAYAAETRSCTVTIFDSFHFQ